MDSQDTGTILLDTSQLGIDWATQIQGQWLEVFVRTKFSEQGSLEMSVTPLGSETPRFTVNKQNIELWRSGSNGSTDNLVRPKWGIYRSLNDKAGLNAGEDEVWFADLEKKKSKR